MEIIGGLIGLAILAAIFGKDDKKNDDGFRNRYPDSRDLSDGYVRDVNGPDYLFNQTGKSPEGYNLDDPEDMERYLNDCP